MKVKLPNVRLAFPDVFVAKAFGDDGGAPSFNATFLIDPATQAPLIAQVDAAIVEAATEKWGPKAAAIMKELRAKDRIALHDGDLKSQYAGFEGQKFVSSRSPVKPLVLDSDKTPLSSQSGKPYAGCYVDAIIEIYAQDNKFGKRVNAVLKGVQFRRDGDAFAGGAAASEDEFEDLSTAETADDLA